MYLYGLADQVLTCSALGNRSSFRATVFFFLHWVQYFTWPNRCVLHTFEDRDTSTYFSMYTGFHWKWQFTVSAILPVMAALQVLRLRCWFLYIRHRITMLHLYEHSLVSSGLFWDVFKNRLTAIFCCQTWSTTPKWLYLSSPLLLVHNINPLFFFSRLLDDSC